MNIIEAIKDPNLFRPFLGDDLKSWKAWMTALRVLYGLPVKQPKSKSLIKQCTGRDAHDIPEDGFNQALFLVGRRSGKSRTAAIIGAYEAALAGHQAKLSKGERGLVPILSPSRYQSRVVKGYIRSIFDTPLLHNEIISETKDGFQLANGTRIEILSGDWRTIRGYTLLACIVDEAAFFGIEAEAKVRSDTELIRALRPSLATTNGKLIAISSPYARRGWCYSQYKQSFANKASKTLVWNCPSRVMNPTLSKTVVEDAIAEDLQAAKSEYLGEFRDDVCSFIPRETVESLVIPGRYEILYDKHIEYSAFVDVSGGRGDDAALAIGHVEGRTLVVDLLRRYKPPHNPYEVIKQMIDEIKRYKIPKVIGDSYAAEFCSSTFNRNGIPYEQCGRNKSELYAELLPRMCSREIELLDNEILIEQLAGLERRVRSGGKDIVDHASGGKDDLANAVAGLTYSATRPVFVAGAF